MEPTLNLLRQSLNQAKKEEHGDAVKNAKKILSEKGIKDLDELLKQLLDDILKKTSGFLPWWWYVSLALVGCIGVVLLVSNPQLPLFNGITLKIPNDKWAIFFGIYLLSIVVTHPIIFFLSKAAHVLLELSTDDTTADRWSPTLVGICESVMYPTSLLLNKAEFIGVWLAVKVAGQWVRWKREGSGLGQTTEQENLGRRRFNRFLFGNALSIICAVLTWAALKKWVC